MAVTQGNVIGRGFYVPICDGTPRTFSVTAVAAQGTFQPGDARALSFADVEWNGTFFDGRRRRAAAARGVIPKRRALPWRGEAERAILVP